MNKSLIKINNTYFIIFQHFKENHPKKHAKIKKKLSPNHQMTADSDFDLNFC